MGNEHHWIKWLSFENSKSTIWRTSRNSHFRVLWSTRIFQLRLQLLALLKNTTRDRSLYVVTQLTVQYTATLWLVLWSNGMWQVGSRSTISFLSCFYSRKCAFEDQKDTLEASGSVKRLITQVSYTKTEMSLSDNDVILKIKGRGYLLSNETFNMGIS